MNNNGAVILAGGKGTRMKSELPKVMCEVLGRPMIDYVIGACKAADCDICVIVGYKAEVVEQFVSGRCETALQSPQLGTGHAVMQADSFIKRHFGGNVLVLCGDAPLMDADTIKNALKMHTNEDNAITVITARLDNPAAYGRIVKKDGKIAAIVEYKDADEQTRAINEINSGAYWFKAEVLCELLGKIDNNNAQNEYYLTDTIKLAIDSGLSVNSYVAERPEVVMGANDREQLKELEAAMQSRK
ncbi:MAG: sugar phosphate nucleotidyltransferase [Acutalibacteraceae bacterium]|nr:sugar phosphate nucleotidyltransferase [Acutalibacteraceae bacterium]